MGDLQGWMLRMEARLAAVEAEVAKASGREAANMQGSRLETVENQQGTVQVWQ
jgi:hypothetical protein